MAKTTRFRNGISGLTWSKKARATPLIVAGIGVASRRAMAAASTPIAVCGGGIEACPPRADVLSSRATNPFSAMPTNRRADAGDEMNYTLTHSSDPVRLSHALVRAEELSVSDLGRTVGMTPQAVSNQLQRLVDRGILDARRNGNSVHHRIADPCVPALLDQGLCLAEDSLSQPGGPLDRGAERVPRRLPERAGTKPR